MTNIILRFHSILFLLIIIFLSNFAYSSQLIISIPNEPMINKLQKQNRATEYKVNLSEARVYGVMKIPIDWDFKIKYLDLTQIEASAGHGSGYLSIEDIKEGILMDFLIIELESNSKQFNIKIDFEFENSMTDEITHIVFNKKDLIIKNYTSCP